MARQDTEDIVSPPPDGRPDSKPSDDADPAARPSEEAPDGENGNDGPHPMARADECLLLVEDEDTVRHVTRRLLGKLGYRVLEASDGAEGVEMYQEHADSIDLLVTDVVMPGQTGTAMAAEIREGNPDLKVLFISGYTSRELGRAPGEPPEPFLAKPFSLGELARAVRSALDD